MGMAEHMHSASPCGIQAKEKSGSDGREDEALAGHHGHAAP